MCVLLRNSMGKYMHFCGQRLCGLERDRTSAHLLCPSASGGGDLTPRAPRAPRKTQRAAGPLTKHPLGSTNALRKMWRRGGSRRPRHRSATTRYAPPTSIAKAQTGGSVGASALWREGTRSLGPSLGHSASWDRRHGATEQRQSAAGHSRSRPSTTRCRLPAAR